MELREYLKFWLVIIVGSVIGFGAAYLADILIPGDSLLLKVLGALLIVFVLGLCETVVPKKWRRKKDEE